MDTTPEIPKVTAAIGSTEYRQLKERLAYTEYAGEMTWAEEPRECPDAISFWRQYTWVVCNSGMAYSVAKGIYENVYAKVMDGRSASVAFNHKGKSAGIDSVFRRRENLFNEWRALDGAWDEDKLNWLQSLPWIGAITRYHLAKNLGMDCAKPDRHLERIAARSKENTASLCERLRRETGDNLALIDMVLWRAAEQGWV